MSSTNHSTNESPILFFEIQSGVTHYPRRPVTRGRFLLGSGDACHMRLGGDDIPPIHSMIVAENGNNVEIELLSTGPALTVNGEVVDSASLNDGDEIAIGRIVFTARFADVAGEAAAAEVDLLADVELTEAELAELKVLESMSVVELVDQIESDMDLVDQHDVGIQTGMESLLFEAAAAGAAEEQESSQESSDEPVELTAESSESARIQQLIEELEAVTVELNERARRLDEREQAYSVAAEELLDQQSRLRAQIELVQRDQSATIRQFPRKSA